MARASEDGEAFQVVLRTARCRLGLVARPPGMFVEATLHLFPGHEVDEAHLERCLAALLELRRAGYELSYGGNGSVAAEKAVTGEPATEVDRATEVLKRLEGV